MNYIGTKSNFSLVCGCGGTDIVIECNDTGYMGSELTGWCDEGMEIKFSCQSCGNEVEFGAEGGDS